MNGREAHALARAWRRPGDNVYRRLQPFIIDLHVIEDKFKRILSAFPRLLFIK